MAAEKAAGYGAGAGGDDQLGLGDGVVGRERRLLHIRGERPSNEDAVGMTGRSNEFDAEAARIEDHVAERVDFDLAAVATARADLAQPQRAPQEPPQLPAQRIDADFPVATVLHGIETAQEVGLGPIKVNMVVKRGQNDQDIVSMARHFKGSPAILAFRSHSAISNVPMPPNVAPPCPDLKTCASIRSYSANVARGS